MKYLRIERADYKGNFTVMLTFNDGAAVTIDFGAWIVAHPHPQHNRYLNEKIFKKKQHNDYDIERKLKTNRDILR